MSAPVITPASKGESQLASKYVLQVDTTPGGAPTWLTVFGMSNFTPNIDYTKQDNSDYDSNGWGGQVTTQRMWNAAVTLQDKLYGGAQDPGQAAIQAAADNLDDLHVRWFDRNGGPDAKEGYCSVEWKPAGGSVTDLSTTGVTLNGQGEPTVITNPMGAALAPTIVSVLPSGAAAGAQVTIKGTHFASVTGAAGVKFGATNAAAYTVVDDLTIVASLPAGSAGAANVVVTNTTGASAAFSYTRGA